MRAGTPGTGRSAATVAALLCRSRVALELPARAALVVAIVALVGLGLVPRTGWYRPVTVLSGSMRPALSPGDVAVLTPEPVRDVRVGQAISYRIPVGDHHVQTHRVIAIVHGGAHPSVRTKGDANRAPDPWVAKLDGSTVWQVRAVLPKVGWVVFWFRTPLMHELTVFVAPLLLALLVLLRIWRGGNNETGAEVPDELARTLSH
jgi:signal peptidase